MNFCGIPILDFNQGIYILCIEIGITEEPGRGEGPTVKATPEESLPPAEEIAIERGYFGDRMRCLAAGVENSLGGWFSPKISQAVLTLAFSRGQTIFQTRLLLGIHRAILLQGI